ncbi:MAG: response regulator, partial [Armatimonadota bacterium]
MDGPAQVLVVDDELGMREGCRRVLAALGHHAEVAATGEEALELAKKQPFDLILLDMKLPGVSGMDLIGEFLKLDPDVVCIMITGYATIQTAVEATKRGVFEYLPKPFTPDELAAMVNKGLERRRWLLEARRLREERERSLLEVAAEKSRSRTIINCMMDGVLVINREGQLVLYNPAAMRMLGIKTSLPEAVPVRGSLGHPELEEIIAGSMSPDETGTAMVVREIEIGEAVLMANVAAIRNDQGETLGLVAVLRDITRLKEIERVKSQFVSMVSHELRAPVAAILSYLDFILSGFAGDDPEQWKRMLARCSERAKSLITLVDDLLQLSRIEAGRVARRLEAVALQDVAREVLDLMSAQAQEKGVTLELHMTGDTALPPVLADREDMSRLVTNLVSNAIKYNRQGGRVDVILAATDGYVRVDVTDTGVGIPQEELPRIWEEFHRVKRPETRGITGTGLGLSLVKRIVEAHHGHL